jgi:hypothetical protein
MEWYSQLADCVLNAPSRSQAGSGEGNRLSGLLLSLKSLIIDLFRDLLRFLMKAAVYLTKHVARQGFANAFKWHDWVGALENANKKEAFIDNKIGQFRESDMANKMGIVALRLNSLLEHEVSRDQNEVLSRLSVGDMDAQMAELQRLKEQPLRDSYNWILKNKAYQQLLGAPWEIGAGESPEGGESRANGKKTGGSEQEKKVLWIKGDPRKGKTMLLMGIVQELKAAQESRLDAPNVSFFFCQGTDSRLNNATAVLRGLLWGLLYRENRRLRRCLGNSKGQRHDVFETPEAFQTLEKLFRDAFEDDTFTPTFFIIDALDECREDQSHLRSLIDFIVSSSKAYPNIKWIVSSRNVTYVKNDSIIPLELNQASVGEAVNAYIRYKLDCLVDEWTEKAEDPTPDVIERLGKIGSSIEELIQKKAEGTFLWVALAFEKVLKHTIPSKALSELDKQVPGLYGYYHSMMDRMLGNSTLSQMSCRVLLVLINAARPPTLKELLVLAGLNPMDPLSKIVSLCELLNVSDESQS